MAEIARTSRIFNISFPPELAEQVERVAKAEGRTISELFRETFRAYEAKRVRRLLRDSQREFERAGVTATEQDVARWVKEVRAERRTKNK